MCSGTMPERCLVIRKFTGERKASAEGYGRETDGIPRRAVGEG